MKRHALIATLASSAAVFALAGAPPASAGAPCAESGGASPACQFDMPEISWAATPAVIDFQARLEQGGLPVGKKSFSVVIVRLLRGGQTICQEQVSGANVEESVLNLQIGHNMSCDLAETIASHVDLTMQVCLDGPAHCLKPVELGLSPYAHRAAFAQIVQRATKAQTAVSANYAQRATADRDLLVRRALGRGFFDFTTPTADELAEVYPDASDAADVAGSGFMLWAPSTPIGDARDLVFAGRELPELGSVSTEQVRVLDQLSLHADETRLGGRLLVSRSLPHTPHFGGAVRMGGGTLSVEGDTDVAAYMNVGSLQVDGELDVDGSWSYIYGDVRMEDDLTVAGELEIYGYAYSGTKGLTVTDGPLNVTGHSKIRGLVTTTTVTQDATYSPCATSSCVEDVGLRVNGTSKLKDLVGDGGLHVWLTTPAAGPTLNITTSATERDYRFDLPVVFEGAVTVDGAVELKGTTINAGGCSAGHAPDAAGTCRDIDECTMGLHNCTGTNRVCTNTAGSFTCGCKFGLKDTDGDGNCTEFDDACLTGAFPCAANAKCVSSFNPANGGSASFACECPSGWLGNGHTRCVDADECLLGTQTCGSNAFCVNRPAGAGAFCRCEPGYLDVHGDASECQPPALRWFTTSGTWVGNLGGLSGAETKCNAEVSAGNKTGKFVPWLSLVSPAKPVKDSLAAAGVDTSAPVRLFNGALMAPSLSSVLAGVALAHAPGIGVAGQVISQWIWTASGTDGNPRDASVSGQHCYKTWKIGCFIPWKCHTQCDTLSADKQDCYGFLDTAVNLGAAGRVTTSAVVGNSGQTSAQFTEGPQRSCADSSGLYCVSKKTYRATRMFVTKGKFNGDLGGPAGADAKCQAEADAARLKGTWKMLRFESGKPQLDEYAMPLVRAWDAKVVSTNRVTLTRDEISNPLNLAADGTVIADGEPVWTSRNSTGTCQGFTLGSYVAADATDYGLVGGAGSGWSTQSSGNANCFVPLHLYCAEVL